MAPRELHTERLILRRFRDDDRASFARLNGDPEVMRHFPAALDHHQSTALIERIEQHFEAHGFGHWAVELKEGGRFVGSVGLWVPSFVAPFTPCVEIGWRLCREAWGRGYASEAAREALRFAFEELRLAEVVSFTVPANEASWRVMERLGMERDPGDDFDHPVVPEGHPLRHHMLYRLRREAWAEAREKGARV